MASSGEMRLTSDLLWTAAIFTALLDSFLLYLLSRWVGRERFRRLFWPAGVAAALVFGAIWTLAMWSFAWNIVYKVVFPAWGRYVIPPGYGLMFGGIALGFWAAAIRFRREPVVVFCVLGGLVSIPGHLIGAARGLFTVPLLRDVSIVSALTFGVLEFIFYFALILVLAVMLRAKWDSIMRKRQPRAHAVGTGT